MKQNDRRRGRPPSLTRTDLLLSGVLVCAFTTRGDFLLRSTAPR
jgi:hypothetical protein